MAKDFAKQFYNSKLWRTVRAAVLRRDLFTCQDCGQRATEVHHIVELTPENINDMAITLSMDNLSSLCWYCHKRRTHCEGDVGSDLEFDETGQVVRSPRRVSQN